MNIITIIIFLGMIQGVSIGLLILTLKRGNVKANRLLGIMMILFSVSISDFLFIYMGWEKQLSFIQSIPSTVIFLFGPLFYFYVIALTKISYNYTPKILVHFIPFFLFLLYKVFEPDSQLVLSAPHPRHFTPTEVVIISLQIIHVFIYMFYTRRLLFANQLKMKFTMSTIDNINFRWLKLSLFLFEFIFGTIAVFLILSVYGFNVHYYFNTIIPLSVSLVILVMGYLSFHQPIVFPVEEDGKARKYERSTLSADKSDEYLNKLKLVMDEEKLFLDSKLTLHKLSDYVGISPQHLSQVINERMNQNFFDFINSYRILEAKRLLVDPRGELLTILAIAEEVGFNSKSSFNTAFKKISGMTPTEYKKSFPVNS